MFQFLSEKLRYENQVAMLEMKQTSKDALLEMKKELREVRDELKSTTISSTNAAPLSPNFVVSPPTDSLTASSPDVFSSSRFHDNSRKVDGHSSIVKNEISSNRFSHGGVIPSRHYMVDQNVKNPSINRTIASSSGKASNYNHAIDRISQISNS